MFTQNEKKSRFRNFDSDDVIRVAELIVFKLTITTTMTIKDRNNRISNYKISFFMIHSTF